MRSVAAHDVAETRRAIHEMLVFVFDLLEACNARSKTFVDVVEHFSFGVQNKPVVEFSQRNLEFHELVIIGDVFDVNSDFEATLK